MQTFALSKVKQLRATQQGGAVAAVPAPQAPAADGDVEMADGTVAGSQTAVAAPAPSTASGARLIPQNNAAASPSLADRKLQFLPYSRIFPQT